MNRPAPRALALLAAVLLLGSAMPAAAAGAAPQPTWHADQARVPDARDAGRHGEGVLVAVLDTWVDAAHRDFEGRVVVGADCSTGTCREGVPAPDSCDHGTHVAGTVASSSFGVATKARILPVKVLSYEPSDDDCSGSPRDVAAGIRYAVARGATVLNLSLGTLVPGLSSSTDITNAVQEAARAGAVVVFAAGNSTVPLADSYGGGAIIVAATGPDGSLATYSQRGAGVTMAAPGGAPPTLESCSKSTCVTSLLPGDKYAVAAGTSMAAPHVAGVAALLLGQDPRRGRQDVIDRLRRTARPVVGGGAGDGLVDATAALAGGTGAPAPQQPTRPAQDAANPPAEPGGASGAPSAPSDSPPTAQIPPAQTDPAPLPLDGGPVAEQPAAEQPVALPGIDPSQDAGPQEPLPSGPPALAVALILAAGLAMTAVAGLRRR